MARRKRRMSRKARAAAMRNLRKAWKRSGRRRRSSRRRRRNPRPWNKGKHLTHRKSIAGYSRKPSVKRHYRRVNPFGIRMPSMPTVKGVMGDVQQGLIAGAVLLGTFVGASWVGKKLEAVVPGAQMGIPNFILKFGTALGTVYVARMVLRDPGLRRVALGGAFMPLALEGIGMVAPQVAAQVPLIGMTAAPSAAPEAASAAALGAELEAELEMETESSLY